MNKNLYNIMLYLSYGVMPGTYDYKPFLTIGYAPCQSLVITKIKGSSDDVTGLSHHIL